MNKSSFLNSILPLATLLLLSTACNPTSEKNTTEFAQSSKNAAIANEGFQRCLAFTKDWLSMADPKSGLFPENLGKGKDIWNGHNSAADNYPFMVLTAMLLDEELLTNEMTDILNFESTYTTRIGSLCDDYSFSKGGFAREAIDTALIIFASSEYVKDGLIPLTEYAGDSPWRDRMFNIIDDLQKLATHDNLFDPKFFGESKETEVYGELLQALTRSYWITKNQSYLDWAISIGDHYLIDYPERLMKDESIRLRDHGCEIIGGLSELYATLHFVDKSKKAEYKKPLYAFLDRVLEVGRNEDGMLYIEVDMVNNKIVEEGLVDNWGYIYNAYYTVYLIDQHEPYRQAVLKPLPLLRDNYHNYNWERYGADGFADAIESGINLYNREPIPELWEWVENEVKLFWSIQDSAFRPECLIYKDRGIIEGWHGDGNFARTTIMYCLQKTSDTTIKPWREDVAYGTSQVGDTLYITLSGKKEWAGQLNFSPSRQTSVMPLPMDYPRINQFPQWFPIDPNAQYSWTDYSTSKTTSLSGTELINGKDIALNANQTLEILLFKKP